MRVMKRALLLLPILLLSGCVLDRKAQIESELPGLITAKMHKTSSPTNNNAEAICERVTLVKESDGHYVGTAYFKGNLETKVTVVDDGGAIEWETQPF